MYQIHLDQRSKTDILEQVFFFTLGRSVIYHSILTYTLR